MYLPRLCHIANTGARPGMQLQWMSTREITINHSGNSIKENKPSNPKIEAFIKGYVAAWYKEAGQILSGPIQQH